MVVTGATAGIGLAIAERLGQEGAHVVICSRRQKNVDEALNGLRGKGIDCVGIACHVAKEADRKALLELASKKKGCTLLGRVAAPLAYCCPDGFAA